MPKPGFPAYMTPNTYDAVANGELLTNLEPRIVFVESAADLAVLTGYAPGAFAISYDLASIWACKPDGSWTLTDSQAAAQ